MLIIKRILAVFLVIFVVLLTFGLGVAGGMALGSIFMLPSYIIYLIVLIRLKIKWNKY